MFLLWSRVDEYNNWKQHRELTLSLPSTHHALVVLYANLPTTYDVLLNRGNDLPLLMLNLLSIERVKESIP